MQQIPMYVPVKLAEHLNIPVDSYCTKWTTTFEAMVTNNSIAASILSTHFESKVTLSWTHKTIKTYKGQVQRWIPTVKGLKKYQIKRFNTKFKKGFTYKTIGTIETLKFLYLKGWIA